jgi:hypothetical protein
MAIVPGWTCAACRTVNAGEDGFCGWCGAPRPGRIVEAMAGAGRGVTVGLALVLAVALGVLWLGTQDGEWWDSPGAFALRTIAFLVAGAAILVGVPIAVLGAIARRVDERANRPSAGRPWTAPIGRRPPAVAAVWQVTLDGIVHRVWIRHAQSGPSVAWVDDRAVPVTREREGAWSLEVVGHPAMLRAMLTLLGDWVTGRYEDADLWVEGATVRRIR